MHREDHDQHISDQVKSTDCRKGNILISTMARNSWVPILCKGLANEEYLQHTSEPIRPGTSHAQPGSEAKSAGYKDTLVEEKVG